MLSHSLFDLSVLAVFRLRRLILSPGDRESAESGFEPDRRDRRARAAQTIYCSIHSKHSFESNNQSLDSIFVSNYKSFMSGTNLE